jgi:hypothetical protein
MQEETVRLALLERAQENTEKEMATLREAISEISKVNVRISELLAVHQVKIEQEQQRGDDTNRKVEEGIRGLTLKMDNDRTTIYEKMDTDKAEVVKEVKGLRDKVFIGIGIGIVLNIIAAVAIPQLFNSGPLTNSQNRAMVWVLDRG